jgi:hypothetical protein
VTDFTIQLLGEGADSTGSLLVSIAAHLGFGLGLFYGVQKFFEEVEKKLNVQTKKEIAVWLFALRPTRTIQGWRSTFPKIFNRVFGDKHFSWKCFRRSCVVTAVTTFVAMLAGELLEPRHALNTTQITRVARNLALLYFSGIFGSLFTDYISLWKTRSLINLSRNVKQVSLNVLFLLIDTIATFGLAICAAFIGNTLYSAILFGDFSIANAVGTAWVLSFTIVRAPENVRWVYFTVWFIPAFFGRLWLLAYVGCGLLLKVARRLDIGFAWFNRRFDVQEHPLQCIGLVAGAISALAYWLLVSIRILP